MIDQSELTEDQKEIVKQYQVVHAKLVLLEDQMKGLSAEANKLMEDLESIREKDKKLFNNYGKKE